MTQERELDPELVKNVKDAMSVWVEEQPDEPVLRAENGSMNFTPRQLLEEVSKPTEFGLKWLRTYDEGLVSRGQRERQSIFLLITGHGENPEK